MGNCYDLDDGNDGERMECTLQNKNMVDLMSMKADNDGTLDSIKTKVEIYAIAKSTTMVWETKL